ncbi:MAG: protein-glutamate O-methyltransferase CheR [Alphaproteobacteria bacterium]|nr:protein-glutamate O-methyltransferase CheR [Alphaproteobacteria bacterium]
MHADDFQTLSSLLKKRSGLSLTEDKSYLLESRLMPLVRRRRYSGLPELVQAIRIKPDDSLLTEVTEVMTTNESFFFRDTRPFDQFRDVVLPQLKQSRASKKRIRIWSAACSSGQEPYSLAIVIKEMGAEFAGWNIEIVGTDISEAILEKAREGIYSQFEVQRGLPIQLLMKYFTQVDTGWELDESIRSMVQYRYFNLLDSMSALGTFDVVYCRNVLIYFDQPTKSDVLSRIRRQMSDDAVLYLGGAETVLGICEEFKPVTGQRGMYCIVNESAERLVG